MDVDLKNQIKEELAEAIGEDNVFIDEPMYKHTSFKTGGSADFFVIPHNGDEIDKIFRIAKKYNQDTIIFGHGSNTLVTDKGIRGIVIALRGLNKVVIDDEAKTIKVGAGVPIIFACSDALEHGFTGLEFAYGIPGTIGGAIFMNAGAYGGEFKDIITSVRYYDSNTKEVKVLSNEECKFGYRESIFQSMNNCIILGCLLQFKPGNVEEIKAKMDENMTSRRTKQPLNYPSAGSTFKREEGIIVSKLIDEAGLKGCKIGGAEVSILHAGFIINSGGATSQDILDLIEHVKKVVKEKYGVDIHEEIKIVGER